MMNTRLAIASLALTLFGCGGGSSAPPTPTAVETTLNLDLQNLANYAAPALPLYYDASVLATDNTPGTDPVDDKIATLGRVLFYDTKLSVNNAISCAGCHLQAQGFGDVNRFSLGFSGAAFTDAHAMRLGNLRFFKSGRMFWNQRAASVEEQASQPIQHPVEMGFDSTAGGLSALFTKMRTLPYYTELFTFAFGDATITEARLQRALAQFQRAMVSVNSKWDSAYASVYNPALPDKGLGLPLAGLSAQEDRGRALFMLSPQQGGMGCAACHVPPSFALAAGVGGIGLDAGETTIFKAPSLKNVGLGSAFMHDGRFSTLEQVVDHYAGGVQAGPALDPSLLGPGGTPRQFNLSVAEKAGLVAFMRSLTDPVFTTDAKFSNPFK